MLATAGSRGYITVFMSKRSKVPKLPTYVQCSVHKNTKKVKGGRTVESEAHSPPCNVPPGLVYPNS